ncbi:ATP-dependent DNA ligase [Halalkalibacter krulwichiae]|uniref:Putative DNA ligase-like protein/MT0965 n=2 Tax=Halalkalibacter krulwichiae TaxID=199441 RepID=A0A1X9MD88_9BACI|nr:hypothetical protein [Halalkalibacter krulwichiae]ARK30604.1 Putative DNA ligase-like protein/MT0965 [Halalkalibacter krulwichiae]
MFLSPMLLKEVDTPPEDYANVITELKLDGIRIIFSNLNNNPRLYTRTGHDVTHLFPELISVQLPKGVILDGELIVPDRNNKPSYRLLMDKIKQKETTLSVQYVAYDLLYYRGEKITQFPLLKRKKILDQIIPTDTITIVTSQWFEGNSQTYFEVVKRYGLEGIVVKKPMSKYRCGVRSGDWVKILNRDYEDNLTLRSDFESWLVNDNKKKVVFLNIQLKKNRKNLYEYYRKFITGNKKDSSQ